MKAKRFAQYVCAAILAFGFGLNIQNALTGYGIGKNSLSLLASDETDFFGSESCFDGTVSFGTCTVPDAEDVMYIIRRCGQFAGKWILRGKKIILGIGTVDVIYISWDMMTYQEYDSYQRENKDIDAQGKEITRRYTQYICTEKFGISKSNCDPVGTFYTVDGWE